MQLYFLGTGAGMPSRQRNVSSLVLDLLDECAGCWMFDCGEGTQHQILQAPVKLAKIHKLFVTHLHGDHIFGIPGLLASRSNHGAEEPLTVYGPTGIRQFIDTSLAVSDSRMKFELNIVEYAGEGIIHEEERFWVEAARLDHRTECFGFRIVERDRTGSLDVEKLKRLGIPPGPVYGRLKQGATVELPDGTIVDGKEFIGPPIPGRVVAILGDTRYCRESVRLSRRADVLVHEATFSSDRKEQAEMFCHSTAAQAAEVARQAEVRTLILTHISSRYQNDGAEMLLKEARDVFPNTYLARDFWSYAVPPKRARNDAACENRPH
jgi:ribonuclease Z